MNKRFSAIVAAVLVLFAGPVVSAQGESSMVLTDTQIGLIKMNCVSAQSTLTRIHTNDALSRVHLGREYETISSKFMAPMNSRVALAKLDSVEMVKTTVEFNDKLGDFRSSYQQYEQTLLKAIQIKCMDQPVAFYDTVVLAREYRQKVRENVIALGELTTQYSGQVKALRAKVGADK